MALSIDRQGLETVVNLGRTWVSQLPVLVVVEADAEKYDDFEGPGDKQGLQFWIERLEGCQASWDLKTRTDALIRNAPFSCLAD
jgi:hypothetical protein